MTETDDSTVHVPRRLLPCPFCGRDRAVLHELDPRNVRDVGEIVPAQVRCGFCGCQTSVQMNDVGAILAWNTRNGMLP